MNAKQKIKNMSAMRRLVMGAAFSAGIWDSKDLYFGSSGSRNKGNPMYAPKIKKLKGYQKH